MSQFECSSCIIRSDRSGGIPDREREQEFTSTSWFNWQTICCLASWKEVKRGIEMNGLCCCTPCKPRYRRLVDSIYPRAITDGLISSNMQKLIFYAISHPEKLERIGEYLVMRLGRDLGRQRYIQVKVTINSTSFPV
uniref:DUF721 domain-containing protein n=1 Tax=Heterorhabditis bacteriophora TaxID=37862 RepID=A0A1I7XPQ5_HETBA